QELAKGSAKHFNLQSNSMHYFVPVKVVSAQSQVVAGTNWKLVVQFQASKRTKHEGDIDVDEFKANPDGEK
ncbi:hypothetical protein AB6A40_011729, partial [Gnathostoma spinigerum]